MFNVLVDMKIEFQIKISENKKPKMVFIVFKSFGGGRFHWMLQTINDAADCYDCIF